MTRASTTASAALSQPKHDCVSRQATCARAILSAALADGHRSMQLKQLTHKKSLYQNAQLDLTRCSQRTSSAFVQPHVGTRHGRGRITWTARDSNPDTPLPCRTSEADSCSSATQQTVGSCRAISRKKRAKGRACAPALRPGHRKAQVLALNPNHQREEK